MKNEKLHAPAFPPVPMQDNYGRFVSVMPGLTKLEFISALMLPTAIRIKEKHKVISMGNKECTVYEAAELMATELINHLNPEDEKPTATIQQL